MMNGAIFGQKQADLKYVTDSLAFAHIAMHCLLFLLISPVNFGMLRWHVTRVAQPAEVGGYVLKHIGFILTPDI